MKTKSKIAISIKDNTLAKSKVYARPASKDDSIEKIVTDEDREIKKEKKRKMKLRKEMKKEARINSVKKDDKEAKKDALKYLHLWSSSRDLWSFKKKQQHWLLINIFKTNLINDKNFDIILEYILELKGASKTRLLEESEKIIKMMEENPDKEDEDASITFERARKIQQVLI